MGTEGMPQTVKGSEVPWKFYRIADRPRLLVKHLVRYPPALFAGENVLAGSGVIP